ncbi:iron-containing redox enzyme family protein [Streptacidiphilus rugosus]|uniref:iron-containing redox enzyme family protein n=1 Tax=Streptacidiphilus rugosus TaxID=405783 RepID=UPI0006911DE0|nr:iron-containing redox enzyme family protein [Streptacidiphilus rugosus]
MSAAARVGAGRRLRAALDQLAPAVTLAGARLWSPDADAARYRCWLRTAYQIVRATEPLIAEALAECLRRDDPVSAELAPWLAAHLREEHGHDRWLLADYAAVGGDQEELRRALPGGAVARFAGAPGYWIRHVHPLGLLGHIALLEWYPPAPGTADALARRTGLPASAFRALRAHAGLDRDHGDRLGDFLDSLDLDADGHRLLLSAATTSASGLTEIVAAILAGAAPGSRPHTPTEEPWPTWTA